MQLDICDSCAPAALQLVECGLFPCAPLYPTLAVKMDLLDLVSILFMVKALNITGWSDTFTKFLVKRSYYLGSVVRTSF
jgi:CxC1 like cysteine cluster associated with KDZ transposases